LTFETNARIKARHAARATGLPALADDSGIEVEALDGGPGVRTRRYAGPSATDAENNAKLLRLLRGVPEAKRTARFRCVIAFTPVPKIIAKAASPVCEANEAEVGTELFSGVCEGHIIELPRGTHGFGYDPLFVPVGHSQSFSELSEEQKNRTSHRSKALEKLKARLRAKTR